MPYFIFTKNVLNVIDLYHNKKIIIKCNCIVVLTLKVQINVYNSFYLFLMHLERFNKDYMVQQSIHSSTTSLSSHSMMHVSVYCLGESLCEYKCGWFRVCGTISCSQTGSTCTSTVSKNTQELTDFSKKYLTQLFKYSEAYSGGGLWRLSLSPSPWKEKTNLALLSIWNDR